MGMLKNHGQKKKKKNPKNKTTTTTTSKKKKKKKKKQQHKKTLFFFFFLHLKILFPVSLYKTVPQIICWYPYISRFVKGAVGEIDNS